MSRFATLEDVEDLAPGYVRGVLGHAGTCRLERGLLDAAQWYVVA